MSSSVSLKGLSTKFCLVDVDGSALGGYDFVLPAVTSFSLSSGMESGGRSAKKKIKIGADATTALYIKNDISRQLRLTFFSY